jgi:hypothetical protein
LIVDILLAALSLIGIGYSVTILRLAAARSQIRPRPEPSGLGAVATTVALRRSFVALYAAVPLPRAAMGPAPVGAPGVMPRQRRRQACARASLCRRGASHVGR